MDSDLPFLPERMKINKCTKLVRNLYDKNNCVVHIRSLKQALNHGLILKKFNRVIQYNSVFGKTMENVRKHRDIKLITTDKRRYQLVSEPNYHATKWFSENVLVIEMKKIKVKMNKPVYLGLSILEISKSLMYEFCYDYIKPKYGDNVKLCYMDTDSFKIHIKTEYLFLRYC